MKKILNLIFIAAIVMGVLSVASLKAYASDYQGEENRGSVFQVLGDLITGNYKIDGKPIKEKGWLKVTADETKKIKLFSKEDTTSTSKSTTP